MPWLIPVAVITGVGAAAVGLGLRAASRAGVRVATGSWNLFSSSPRALVMYAANVRSDSPGDAGVFLNNATLAACALGADAVPIRSGQDVINAIRQAPSGLTRVVLIGHGTQDKFFEPRSFGLRTARRGGDQLPAWVSSETFSRELARKAARGVIVSLAGCSAGASPSEYRNQATITGDGGADSLAAHIRDYLVAAGAGGNHGEVRAHTTRGTVLQNPQGRRFKIKTGWQGRPGEHIMGLVWGRAALGSRNPGDWDRYARGPIASRWMLGEALPLSSNERS